MQATPRDGKSAKEILEAETLQILADAVITTAKTSRPARMTASRSTCRRTRQWEAREARSLRPKGFQLRCRYNTYRCPAAKLCIRQKEALDEHERPIEIRYLGSKASCGSCP